MPRYRVCDQHIVWKGQYLSPGTEVEVTARDHKAIWEGLASKRVAERVKPASAPAEPPQEEGAQTTDGAE